MRCAEARRTIVESSWTEISDARRALLDRHLDGCVSCLEEARVERVLRDDLGLLREPLPFELNVVARVRIEIDRRQPVRDEVPARQAGWAAATALAFTIALTAAFVGTLPPWPILAAAARSLFLAAQELVGSAAAAALALLALPARLFSVLFEALAAFGSVLRLLQPAAATSIVIAYLIMGAIIVTVFRRDWAVRAPVVSSEEH